MNRNGGKEVLMNTIGIIAEYNPFHNGHSYQIDSIRKQTWADNIVIIMSGDFVQRGTPAWTDKYLRTKMALTCGADLVFELPAVFSTASAESFANAGVSLLSSLGFVDGICFGAENHNLADLQETAAFLADPPSAFEESIHTLTASGMTYPAARQQALTKHLKELCLVYPTLFSEPNNILALEYLKAILRQDSHLTPFLIPRKGSPYHKEQLDSTFSSATAIRKASLAGCSSLAPCSQIPISQKEAFLQKIGPVVPNKVLVLLREYTNHYPISENDFSDILYYRLTHLSKEDMKILDMTEEIFNRIQKHITNYTSFSDFTAQIKTKQYTYSRISRVLLHCLLNIDTSCTPKFYPTFVDNTLPCVPYARLLGFRRKKSGLLRKVSNLPVITKPADGFTQISAFYNNTPSMESYIRYAHTLYEKDIFASNLYRQIQNSTLGCTCANEYHCQPVIL